MGAERLHLRQQRRVPQVTTTPPHTTPQRLALHLTAPLVRFPVTGLARPSRTQAASAYVSGSATVASALHPSARHIALTCTVLFRELCCLAQQKLILSHPFVSGGVLVVIVLLLLFFIYIMCDSMRDEEEEAKAIANAKAKAKADKTAAILDAATGNGNGAAAAAAANGNANGEVELPGGAAAKPRRTQRAE